ncbi:MAG: 39S ribosomal protein L45 [Polaromonas sp.]|nr:39S ribosomal protein L45 [Polaromonas sp.]
MKIYSMVLSAILVATLALAGADAEAKRMGGGKSVGKQSSNVTQREATPGGANTPSNSASPAAAGATGAGAAAAAPKKPWGAMLGGLAAGLGLAWLASSLGLGGAFGQIIMFALLALVIMVAVGFVMRKLKSGKNQAEDSAARTQTPFAFEGAGRTGPAPVYSPKNVGNDASARPFERSGPLAFEASREQTTGTAGSGSMIGSALLGSQNWGVPAGFDAEGFLKACKGNFITLQDAWDRSDIQSLRAMMTDEMLDQIKAQLADRESHTGGVANKTEVVMIEAQLLGIEELQDSYLASVEFSGMIKEDASAGASPFREVWNMTKPRSGGGWLVAGVQALQ